MEPIDPDAVYTAKQARPLSGASSRRFFEALYRGDLPSTWSPPSYQIRGKDLLAWRERDAGQGNGAQRTREVRRRDTKFLTIGEAAKRLGVSAQTLRAWADAGMISVVRTIGGHRRFERTVIERLRCDEGFQNTKRLPRPAPDIF